MAFKGTDRRSSLDIATEIENVGGHLNAYTSRETTVYFATVLKENINLALDIISDIVLHSIFDNDELDRERGVVLQEISQANDTPDDIVFDLFQETAYPDQPLGRPILGTADSVGSMSRRTLVDYINRQYGSDKMVVAAAGNLDPEDFERRAEDAFKGMSISTAPPPLQVIIEEGRTRYPRLRTNPPQMGLKVLVSMIRIIIRWPFCRQH